MKNKDLKDDFILHVRSYRKRQTEQNSIKNWMLKKILKNIQNSHTMKGSGSYFYSGKQFQNSIVKVSYSVNKHSGQWRAHGRYLEREGAQIEGEKGKGFSEEKAEEIDIAATLGEWQKEGDELVWKIVISPEQADRLNLKEHTRRFMEKMEEDFGFKLEWVAIDHYNTDNPHVHIVVRGRDSKNQALVINKNYIKQGMRYRSRQEATRVLGIRLNDDLLKRRQAVIMQKRLTELDREIIKIKNAKNQVTFKGQLPKNDFETEKRLQIIGRLQFLESIGFVEKKGAITWEISPELENGLRTYQMAQDIIKRKSQHISKITDPDLPLVYTKLVKGESVAGRVIGFGLHNELVDKRYMLIEGLDGKVHYTHPSYKILKLRDAKDIHNGDVVYLSVNSFMKDGKEKTYLSFQNWGSLEHILNSSYVTEADLYLSSIKNVPKNTGKPLTFRSEFFHKVGERVRDFQKNGLLKHILQKRKY